MMDRHTVTQLVERAVASLVEKEPELLDLDVSERALAHRLACYISELVPSGLSVDVEYNRHRADPKRLDLPRRDALDRELRATTVFPDIIVRGSSTASSDKVPFSKRGGSVKSHESRVSEACRAGTRIHQAPWRGPAV